MVARGVLNYDSFKVKGQMGSRALRNLVRAQEIISEIAPYNYVEIGSYLGRSLQPHIDDSDCAHVLSIDLRPDVAGDERGDVGMYRGISADDMIANLAQYCSAADLEKLETVTDTSDCLRHRQDKRGYHLAMIDGEHTVTAAFRDFVNLLEVMHDDAIIMFDDTFVILPAIHNASTVLEARGVDHHVVYCRGATTIIGTGAMAEAVRTGIEPELQVGADTALKRYRSRSHQSAVEQGLKAALQTNPKLRDTALKELRAQGYGISDPVS